MNADTDVNLFGFSPCGVVCTKLCLNLLRALYGMHHGGKIDQKGIPYSFDEYAVALSDGLLEEVIMGVQQPQHPGFIRAHLPTEAHHVGEHDRREPPRLCGCCAAGVSLHETDYSAGIVLLSIGHHCLADDICSISARALCSGSVSNPSVNQSYNPTSNWHASARLS